MSAPLAPSSEPASTADLVRGRARIPHRYRHRAREARDGRDAQGRRDHGRRHTRTGQDRRGRRRGRGDGPRAGAGGHPGAGRRVADERPGHGRRDHLRGLDPGDGEGAHRALRRGAGPAVARRRLRRRVRGAHPSGLQPSHRQVGVHRSLRLRRNESRGGAAADRRGSRDDSVEGRGGHGRRVERGHAHAVDRRPHPPADVRVAGRVVRARPRSCRPRTTSSPRWRRRESYPWCCSPPAASRRPPTRR